MGEDEPDVVVEERVVVELKAVRALDNSHRAQLVNYLKAAGARVGLLVDFGAGRLQGQAAHPWNSRFGVFDVFGGSIFSCASASGNVPPVNPQGGLRSARLAERGTAIPESVSHDRGPRRRVRI